MRGASFASWQLLPVAVTAMTAYGITPIHLNEATCLEAAQWYLEHSLYPIPWEVRGDRKAVTLKGFSYDEYLSAPKEKIQELLSLWQDGWQVGLALAEPGGIFAIDVDSWDELHTFEKDHGEMPREDDTWWHATGRDDGGAHVMFQRGHLLNEWPGHGPFSRALTHIEVKSKGFIAVPPSTHPSGRKYQWIGKSSGITGVPHFLAASLNERQSKRTYAITDMASGNGYTATGLSAADLIKDGVPDGVPQDNALRDLVWDLVQQGLPDAFIQSTWQVVVDKSPLTKESQPWTPTDFERHLRGAREKLGGGLSAAELSWVRRTGVSPHPGPADPKGEEDAGPGADAASSHVTDLAPMPGDPGQSTPIGPVAGDARAPDGVDAPPDPVDVTGRTDAEHRVWLSGQLMRSHTDNSLDMMATHDHLPYSDLGSAQLLVRLYPGLFHFSTQEHRWRIWDGVIHRPAEDGDIANVIVRYAEAYRQALTRIKAAMFAEGAASGDDENTIRERYEARWKRHRGYRDRLWDQPRQGLLLRQMETTVCAVSESKFDRDPDTAACDNGVLVLGPGIVMLQPHSCDRLITKRLGGSLAWDADAKAPVFDHFLETSIRDEDQREWLQMALGMALFGRPLKGFINFIGRNDSGKSTLSRIMHTVFGTYATSIGIDAFLEGSAGNNEFRLHELKGVRLALAAEPAPGRKIDSEAIKTVTGQDVMKTRQPYAQYTEWYPQVLIVISSNQPMRLDTADVAMMKRLRPVAFTQADHIDPTLERRIRRTELQGVLRWLVEGAEKATQLGEEKAFEPVGTMVELREQMAESVDEVLQFVTEAMEQGWLKKAEYNGTRREFVLVGDLYSRYLVHCGIEGIQRSVGKRTFSARVDRLYPVVSSNGKRFRGLVMD